MVDDVRASQMVVSVVVVMRLKVIMCFACFCNDNHVEDKYNMVIVK